MTALCVSAVKQMFPFEEAFDSGAQSSHTGIPREIPSSDGDFVVVTGLA